MLALMGRFGRLGNQLWTYANVLAYALDKKIPFINSAFEGGAFFNGIHASAIANCGVKKIVWDGLAFKMLVRCVYKINLKTRYFPFIQLGESNLLNLNLPSEHETDLKKFRFVFLSGFYFYAPESLERNKAYIKQYFSLIPDLDERVSALVSTARVNADALIGVHIRHGDYRTFCGGLMYYTAEQYADVMRCIVEQIPNQKVTFLICSDEVQDSVLFRGLNVYQSDEEPVVDMYALGRCDYIVGPNSSFTQWASFYGDVPLHVLDWKTAETYGIMEPIHKPDLVKNFSIYSPLIFGKYSGKQVFLSEFLKAVR